MKIERLQHRNIKKDRVQIQRMTTTKNEVCVKTKKCTFKFSFYQNTNIRPFSAMTTDKNDEKQQQEINFKFMKNKMKIKVLNGDRV